MPDDAISIRQKLISACALNNHHHNAQIKPKALPEGKGVIDWD
jgi:hypothetical protein